MSAVELINPATEQVLGTVDLLDAAAVDDAVAVESTPVVVTIQKPT